MNEVIHSFSPDTSEQLLFLLLGIVVFFICAFLFWFANKKKKSLLLMFSGFIGMIALSTAIFSFLTQERIEQVDIYKDSISIGEKNITYGDIRMIKVESIEQHSKYPITKDDKPIVIDTDSLMVIEEYSGQVYILANDNYPVSKIYRKIEEQVVGWRERNGVQDR